MIHFAFGGFGSGKSYYGLKTIRSELLETSRGIATNLAIKEPELAKYFHDERPDAHVCLHQRLRILTDAEVADFFVHRISLNHLWYDIPMPDKDAEKRGARPDWSRWRDHGMLFIIEEAHEFFNSYAWQEIGRSFRAYKNQNRKFSDDILFITPQLTEIDKQLRTSGQSYTELTNLGQLTVKGIQMPKTFVARTYATPPGPNSKATSIVPYALDPKLAACYDTAKGVRGVQGHRADLDAKRKGLNWKWVVLAGVLLICLALYGWHLMSRKFHSFAGSMAAKKAAAHAQPASTNMAKSGGLLETLGVKPPAAGQGAARVEVDYREPEIYMIGLAPVEFRNGVPSRFKIWFSDETQIYSDDLRVKYLTQDLIVVGNRTYYWRGERIR